MHLSLYTNKTTTTKYTSGESSIDEEIIIPNRIPICGPKSWKENRDDGSYNQEVSQIFENIEVDIEPRNITKIPK